MSGFFSFQEIAGIKNLIKMLRVIEIKCIIKIQN